MVTADVAVSGSRSEVSDGGRCRTRGKAAVPDLEDGSYSARLQGARAPGLKSWEAAAADSAKSTHGPCAALDSVLRPTKRRCAGLRGMPVHPPSSGRQLVTHAMETWLVYSCISTWV